MVGLLVAFVVLAAVMIVVGAIVGRRRTRALVEWATAHGWSYREDADGGDWAGFLPQGRRRRGVKCQLDGTWNGRPVTVADYWYQTSQWQGDTRRIKTHHLAVVVVHLTVGREFVTAPAIATTAKQGLPPWQLHGNELIVTWRGALTAADLDSRLGQALTVAGQIEPAS